MAIANSHGWEILVDQPFAATWSGGFDPDDMQVSFFEQRSPLPASHFGQGVLTFRVGYLFETGEQHNLWIMGPINYPKDGMMPLCGIVETDWAPYTFTMNWLFTRPGTVRFERGEPFCHFFPVPRHLLSTVGPEIRDMDKESEKSRAHASWRTLRGGFLVTAGNTTAVLGAVTAGAPALLIPGGGEQPDVAAWCEQAGLAKVLSPPASVTSEMIFASMREILGDSSSYRHHAGLMRDQFSHYRGFDRAVSALEELLQRISGRTAKAGVL